MTNSHYITSPIGTLKLTEQNNKLLRVDINHAPSTQAANEFFKQAEIEIRAYFKNPQHTFSFKLDLQGTHFQHRVWKALQSIAPGTTITYGALARQLNTSARAIGGACRANPIPIIVPCHRVVAAKHSGGYMGATNGEMHQVKEFLLRHEKLKGTP
jgi:methylated-DNA-[protein]-cysteine S-methyltransferase